MDHNNGLKHPMHIQRFKFNGTLRWKQNYKIISIIITQVFGLLENLLMKFEKQIHNAHAISYNMLVGFNVAY
jgi:hypothetical protein